MKINNGFLTELPEYKKESDSKLKMKILRKYANKIALSARMDFEKVKKNGEYGKEIKYKLKVDKPFLFSIDKSKLIESKKYFFVLS